MYILKFPYKMSKIPQYLFYSPNGQGLFRLRSTKNGIKDAKRNINSGFNRKGVYCEIFLKNPNKRSGPILTKFTFQSKGDTFTAIKNNYRTKSIFGLITKAGKRLVVIYTPKNKKPGKYFANTQATINSSKNGKVAYGEINPKLVDKLVKYMQKAHQCLQNNSCTKTKYLF